MHVSHNTFSKKSNNDLRKEIYTEICTFKVNVCMFYYYTPYDMIEIYKKKLLQLQEYVAITVVTSSTAMIVCLCL